MHHTVCSNAVSVRFQHMDALAMICASKYMKVDIVGSGAIPEVHRKQNQVAELSAISLTRKMSEQQCSCLTAMSLYN